MVGIRALAVVASQAVVLDEGLTEMAYVRVEPCWQVLPVGLPVDDPEHASAKKDEKPRSVRQRSGGMAGVGYRTHRRATVPSPFTSIVSRDTNRDDSKGRISGR